MVGVMAFAAAGVAVVPKVRHYSECALNAAPLATEYGKVLGVLEDVLSEFRSGDPNVQTHAQEAIAKFDDIRTKKNALRPFPRDMEEEAIRLGISQSTSIP